MYVCLCKNITEKQIINAVERGACTLREIRLQFGDLGSQCGKCTLEAKQIVEETSEKIANAKTSQAA